MAADADRRVALVTGGAGALGAALCERLAAAGCAVAICDNDVSRARSVARRVGGQARSWSVDVADSSEVGELFSKVEQALGVPLIVVHCAGNPGRFAPLAQLSDSEWREQTAVHLDAAFFCLRAAAPGMIAAGFGRVINVSSIAGLHGTVCSGAYSAAKAGMIGLTRTAAKELGPFGITVNAIAPGMVATPVNAALHAKGSGFIGSALSQTPTRAMSGAADIAELVAYLVSDAARNVTGQVIAHDGGASISGATDAYMWTRHFNRTEADH
ncbi:MAG: SDR family oxidoreductase [Burkholderiaceae bacterium]|nr:SDR family oxidoreductase [Burkholderiaceae bacterium]